MFNVGDKAKIKSTNTKEQGELLSAETIKVLEDTNFTGEVTQIQDGLIYVGFVDSKKNWVTQVFREEELEVVR